MKVEECWSEKENVIKLWKSNEWLKKMIKWKNERCENECQNFKCDRKWWNVYWECWKCKNAESCKMHEKVKFWKM